MADKSISELVAATAVGSTDLFVLEQTGTAKKLTGQILENWLVALADGHGGIQTIAKTGTSGLVDTYTITYADTTTSTFTVTNGKSVASITQYWAVSTSDTTVPSSWYTTRQTMTPTNKYLWSYLHIAYNDSTSTDTTKSVVGVYGDTGAQTYVWIKYAGVQPTSDSDMGDTPDKWIGIYVGLSSTAPTSYTAYTWYQYKGEKGDTGDASEVTAQSVTYLEGTSGTVVPQGSWTTTVPSVTPGNFLWTRTQLTFNDNTSLTAYSVSRFGIDGTGSVSSVNNQSPDTNGNVALNASNIPTSDNESVQAKLNAHESSIDGLNLFIKNKNIAIFGDSISDENIDWSTTVNDVWVKTFRTITAPYNTTITNYSYSARGYVKKAGGQNIAEVIASTDLSQIDTVVLFAGINDYLDGVPLGDFNSTTSGAFCTALKSINKYIRDKNVFVITPMTSTNSGQHIVGVTQDNYRMALTYWARTNNFMLINGATIPQFYAGSPKFGDNTHPLNAYTPLIAYYILEKIVAGGEQYNITKPVDPIYDYPVIGRYAVLANSSVSFNLDTAYQFAMLFVARSNVATGIYACDEWGAVSALVPANNVTVTKTSSSATVTVTNANNATINVYVMHR